jgi:hypothetical protein
MRPGSAGWGTDCGKVVQSGNPALGTLARPTRLHRVAARAVRSSLGGPRHAASPVSLIVRRRPDGVLAKNKGNGLRISPLGGGTVPGNHSFQPPKRRRAPGAQRQGAHLRHYIRRYAECLTPSHALSKKTSSRSSRSASDLSQPPTSGDIVGRCVVRVTPLSPMRARYGPRRCIPKRVRASPGAVGWITMTGGTR